MMHNKVHAMMILAADQCLITERSDHGIAVDTTTEESSADKGIPRSASPPRLDAATSASESIV
jgi:hypothetical protein